MDGEAGTIRIETFARLDDIPAGIVARLAESGGDDPFARLSWFAVHAAHPPAGLMPRFYLARAPRDRALLLPLWSDPKRRRLFAMTSVYSLGFGPVLAGEGGGRDLLQALIRHIGGERPRWYRADIDILAHSGEQRDRLLADLDEADVRGYAYLRGINHLCPLAGAAFEDWYAARPSRLRNTIRRRERKLREAHQVEIDITSRPGEAQLLSYHAVYAASWKEAEARPALFEALIDALQRDGMLRLGVLRCDGRPVAAQIWIRCGARAIIYKLAHDKAWDESSPGSLLTREMARAIIGEGGVQCLDFGLGDEPYKRDWMRESRPFEGLVLYNRNSLAGRLAFGVRRLVAAIRRPAGS